MTQELHIELPFTFHQPEPGLVASPSYKAAFVFWVATRPARIRGRRPGGDQQRLPYTEAVRPATFTVRCGKPAD